MGESSCKSDISENSNQQSVSVPETKTVLVSENIQPKLLKYNSNSKGIKKKISLQEYRKQIGHRVINQKPTQKIGIRAKQESNLEEKCVGQSPNPDSVTCPHCGSSISCSTNKCLRCMRVFEKEKTVHLTSNLKSLPGNKSSGISQMSKDSSYGTRRTRTQNAPPSRQSRAKFEEPQCVTLSSDEDDDSFQETKKLKCDSTHKSSENLDENPPIVIQEQPNIKECEASNDVSMDLPVDAEDNLGSNDMLRWKEGGLNGTFFAVNCRSARIGSYKIVPVGRVLFSSEGIMLQAPVFQNNDEPSEKSAVINLAIPAQQLLQVDAHFSRLKVIFLNVSPSWSRQLSKKLGLPKSGPYWDSASTDESKKRLTLLPVNLDDVAKNAIKQVFVPQGVYNEINCAEANRILVISSPAEVRDALNRLPPSTAVSAETSVSTTETQDVNGGKEDASKVEIRITRGSIKSLARTVLPVTPMFSWSDGPDRFSVTTEDYVCLNQDNLLNDSIIDFYLRYVFSTKTDDSLKNKCHVFSSFFYQRLTTRPPKVNGRKHPVEDDDSLTLKEKRHSRVKSWTKKVDIFEKDYLVIPINERNHWFLAIVCFPWLSGPVTAIDNQPIKLRPQQTYSKKTTDQQRKFVAVNGESFHIGNTTVTPVNSNSKATKDDQITLNVDTERDEAESDEEELLGPMDYTPVEKLPEIDDPIKQPCILFFDSLAGSAHNRVATTLREYLMVEHQVKKVKPNEKSNVAFRKDAVKPFNSFTKESMISACLDVPQQNNSYDCGIFVLQYAEYFMINPFTDYNLRNLKLSNWFPPHIAGRKRKNIQFLLMRLTKEKNPSADQVLNLLPREDVRIALQDRTKTTPIKENGENKTNTEAMEEDVKPEMCLDKEKVEKGASPTNIVYDQEADNEMEK